MNTVEQSSLKEEYITCSEINENKEDVKWNESNVQAQSIVSNINNSHQVRTDTSTSQSLRNFDQLSKFSTICDYTRTSIRESRLSNILDINGVVSLNKTTVDDEEDAVANIDDVDNQIHYSKFGPPKGLTIFFTENSKLFRI